MRVYWWCLGFGWVDWGEWMGWDVMWCDGFVLLDLYGVDFEIEVYFVF